MKNEIIKVIVPTKEEISGLNELGVDVETHIIKAFSDELHQCIVKTMKDGTTCKKNN